MLFIPFRYIVKDSSLTSKTPLKFLLQGRIQSLRTQTGSQEALYVCDYYKLL